VTNGQDGSTSFTLAGTVAGFNGPINTLALSPSTTFPNWTITGGTAGSSSNVSGTFNFNAMGVGVGGSVTVTDTPDDIVTTVTIGSDGTMNGVVKKISTGSTVATFTVNATGNGSITYADGTSATIANFGLV
jgi:hypothetical protein